MASMCFSGLPQMMVSQWTKVKEIMHKNHTIQNSMITSLEGLGAKYRMDLSATANVREALDVWFEEAFTGLIKTTPDLHNSFQAHWNACYPKLETNIITQPVYRDLRRTLLERSECMAFIEQCRDLYVFEAALIESATKPCLYAMKEHAAIQLQAIHAAVNSINWSQNPAQVGFLALSPGQIPPEDIANLSNMLVNLGKVRESLVAAIQEHIALQNKVVMEIYDYNKHDIEQIAERCFHWSEVASELHTNLACFASTDQRARQLLDQCQQIILDHVYSCLFIDECESFRQQTLTITKDRPQTLSVTLRCLGFTPLERTVSLSNADMNFYPRSKCLLGEDAVFNNIKDAAFTPSGMSYAATFTASLSSPKKIERGGRHDKVTDYLYCMCFGVNIHIPDTHHHRYRRVIYKPNVIMSQTSQKTASIGTLLWNTLARKEPSDNFEERQSIPMQEFKQFLSDYWKKKTQIELTGAQLSYLGNKLGTDDITKQKLLKDPFVRGACFWKWFLSCLNLALKHIKSDYMNGNVIGFISRQDSELELLKHETHLSFLLRFSESDYIESQQQNPTAAIVVSFLYYDENNQPTFEHVKTFGVNNTYLHDQDLAQNLYSMEYNGPNNEREHLLEYVLRRDGRLQAFNEAFSKENRDYNMSSYTEASSRILIKLRSMMRPRAQEMTPMKM